MKLGSNDRTGRVRVGGRGGALEANACSVPPVLCRTEETAFESGMVVRSIPIPSYHRVIRACQSRFML